MYSSQSAAHTSTAAPPISLSSKAAAAAAATAAAIRFPGLPVSRRCSVDPPFPIVDRVIWRTSADETHCNLPGTLSLFFFLSVAGSRLSPQFSLRLPQSCLDKEGSADQSTPVMRCADRRTTGDFGVCLVHDESVFHGTWTAKEEFDHRRFRIADGWPLVALKASHQRPTAK